jgi:hypothetical protein
MIIATQNPVVTMFLSLHAMITTTVLMTIVIQLLAYVFMNQFPVMITMPALMMNAYLNLVAVIVM